MSTSKTYRNGSGLAPAAAMDASLGDASIYREADSDAGSEFAGTGDTRRPDSTNRVPASLADGLKDAASTTARAIKEQASGVAGEVGHELGKTAEAQAARGAEAIRVFARAVDAAGAQLKDQSPEAARYAAAGADKIRSLSNDLASHDASQLVDAASDFARTQPIAFFGAAIATGFALGRFLKSSARTDGSAAPRKQTAV